MKPEELAQTVSGRSSVESQVVQKVLEAAFAILAEELAKEEKVEIHGLGTFVRKTSKKAGKKAKTVFKSWSAKSPKGKGRRTGENRKKAKKKAPKGKTGKSP